MKTKLEKKLYGLIHGLEEIQVEAQAFEERYEVQLRGVHPDQYKSGLNLLHYLALRQRDVSELQNDLGTLGLSRLGRAEPHVLASVHAILHALRSLQGSETKLLRKSPVTIKQGRKIIRKRTNALLGKKLKGSTVRIMVTLPSEAADDYSLVRHMMSAGMNCARINCAHDGPAAWARMVANIERARKATGRGCKIFMDLSGPKIRTGAHAPGPRVTTIKPAKDINGRIVAPEKVTLVPEEPPDAERSDALPDNEVIPISADVFRRIAPGDRISLIDTRGEPTRLEIEKVDVWTARALCASDAHLETGLPISLEDGSGKIRTKGVVGRLPAKEQALLLRVGDTLLIHKDPRPGGSGSRGKGSHGSHRPPQAVGDPNNSYLPRWRDDSIDPAGTRHRAAGAPERTGRAAAGR